jgi:drug/metabolite transporter (DMT)-like permease
MRGATLPTSEDINGNHSIPPDRRTMLLYLGAIACVLLTAAGQLLFKAGANALTGPAGALAVKPLMILLAAFSVYFFTSLGWVLLLKRASLGQLYPVMALSFVVVPLASSFFFGEQLSSKYLVGVIFTVVGVVLCLKSSAPIN